MKSGSLRRSDCGYTYIALLIAVVVIGIGLIAASEVWSQSRQREKEQELLFVGEQFRRAIAFYYERTPGAVKRYPEKLEQLLEDKRYPMKQRYLRRIYRDPMTGKADWGLVKAPGGGIMGVHSRSGEKPIKAAGFIEEHKGFGVAARYSQWRFVYQPAVSSALPALQAPNRKP